jgi:4-amino-4-deoxy-L-arabinose transferase-like glycosyltransferase
MLILLGLTIAGGVLRFIALDRPPLWGDEAATYARIAGTYRELLTVLRDAWFPPLHYQLYWFMSRVIPMDPFGMRLAPAIAGTLMIPAMYFLARQMVAVRESLVVAAFTAFSAYLLAYSRDGKMYMEFWLCVALSTACLLLWARTSRSTAWLAWVAAGVAMVGLHGMGFAVLALHLLFFLTARRTTGLKTVALVIGMLVICSGDAVHYGAFNVVADQIEERGWGASGISWADDRNQGQPTNLIIADSAAAYLFSFLWIQEAQKGNVIEWVSRAMAWALGILLLLMTLGAMPWSRRWVGRRDAVDREPVPSKNELEHGRASRPWHPEGASPGAVGSLLRPTPTHIEPAWRIGLWLSLWIVIPAYVFYCASTDRPVSPRYWIDTIGGLAGGHWWVIACCVISVAALTQVSPLVSRLLGVAIPLAIVWTLIDALVRPAGDAAVPWLERWIDRLTRPVVIGPILAAIAAIWFDRSAETVRGRLAASLKFLLVTGSLLLICFGLYHGIEGYFERRGFVMGRAAETQVAGRQSIWMPRWLAIVWPAVAIAVAILFMHLPTRPLRWAAVCFLLAINLAQFGTRLLADTEAPHGLISADLVSARDSAATRTYVQTGRGGASPGTASIESTAGSYYLQRAVGGPAGPWDIRRNKAWDELNVPRYRGPDRVAADMVARPAITRLIVWTQEPPNSDLFEDDLGPLLGPDWLAAGDRRFHVRAFWNWAEFYQYRRREFVRAEINAEAQGINAEAQR